MRVLLDNCTPDPVARFLGGHETALCRKLGWANISNGDLIDAAEKAGFEVMVSCDQNLTYQQNLTQRRISLVIIGSNRWWLVQRHISEIVAAVNSAVPNSYAFIEIQLPTKPTYIPHSAD